jgi:hypothetical protein
MLVEAWGFLSYKIIYIALLPCGAPRRHLVSVKANLSLELLENHEMVQSPTKFDFLAI